jgi:hypothetical protein
MCEASQQERLKDREHNGHLECHQPMRRMGRGDGCSKGSRYQIAIWPWRRSVRQSNWLFVITLYTSPAPRRGGRTDFPCAAAIRKRKRLKRGHARLETVPQRPMHIHDQIR